MRGKGWIFLEQTQHYALQWVPVAVELLIITKQSIHVQCLVLFALPAMMDVEIFSSCSSIAELTIDLYHKCTQRLKCCEYL